MRYAKGAALALAILALSPSPSFGQSGLSNLTIAPNNSSYQLVSSRRFSLTQFYYTYRAVLTNSGPAITGVTATVTSNTPGVLVVAGQGTVHFDSVPANGQVTSTDTFTLLVNRTVAFAYTDLQWSFQNPFADPGPNQTVPLGSTVTLNASGSTNPSGIGSLTYSWTLQSVPAGSVASLSNANTMVATFVADVTGTYTVQLTVSNGTEGDSAIITVSTSNSPPVANAGPNQTVAVGSTVQLNGSKSFDVDGNPLTYTWNFVSTPATSAAALASPTSVTPSFTADVAGTYIIQLVVNDGLHNSQPSTVTVTTGNTPPVANAGSNQKVNVNSLVQLNGSGSTDVNGNPLWYVWTLNTIPAGSKATLSNPTAVNPTFTADEPGTYVAQLIVNDGFSSSQPSTVTISTNAVQAPTANAGSPQTVAPGATVQLSGSGSTDPQGLPLTYTWSLITLPANSHAVLSATNIVNPTFVADLPGNYVAQLTVNNGFLSSATPSTVTITTADTAPIANAGANQNVAVGGTAFLNGSQSYDPDNETLTYSWTFNSIPTGSNATLVNPTTVNPSFVADVPGTYVVQLVVSDPFLKSTPSTVTITAGTFAVTLSPNPLDLTSGPGTLTVTLNPPTGSSPVSVSLSGFNSTFISVPSSVTVPANSSGANVTVTPLATGTTGVIASAPGYTSGSTVVAVSLPSVSIAFNNNATAVGLTHSISGTVTLSAPAPQNGTTIALSVSPAGALTFNPPSVTIPQGGTSGTFSLTGAALGSTTITAGATGVTSGTATILVVSLGGISVPSGVTVGIGQSTPFTIQLQNPAPIDGTTVTLASSNTAILTVSPTSVVIAPGATKPTTQPEVTGVAAGSATVTVTSGGYATNSATVGVTAPALTITTTSLSNGVVGASYSQTLASTGGISPITWSISSGLLPTGLSLASTTGVISGTPSAPGGTFNFTVKATDSTTGTPQTAMQALSITVGTGLTITTASLPNGVISTPYSQTLASSGGTSPITWSISAGTLPNGLSLASATGIISGTPSATGTSNFTVKATDSTTPTAQTATQALSITVSPALTITTASLPNGAVGGSYSQALASSGGNGTITWSISAGSLPNGLTLTGNTIAGIPSANGTSTFTVTATDSTTPTAQTASKSLSITVSPALTVATSSLPNGVVGASYSQTLTSSGGNGTITWSISAGTLPIGLSLASATGIISGTPSANGTSTFTVTATDSTTPTAQTASKSISITVSPALTVTTTSLPNGVVGASYSQTLASSGGNGAITWSISAGSLPNGLSLASTTGVISGTPTAGGTSTFTVTATDSTTPTAQTASKSLSITVGTGLAVTTSTLPNGVVGASYSQTLTSSGGNGTITWSISAGSLPNGLSLASATGIISGTPSANGTSTFTVTATDSTTPTAQTASRSLSITVSPALTVTTTSLPNGVVGASYSQVLASSGGNGTITWSISAGSLPNGLTLTGNTISGTPSANGTSTFTVTATDSTTPTAQTASKSLSITVSPALTVTTTSLPNGVVGASYSQTLASSGGNGTITWSISAGTLPSGLSLASATGIISGTPTAGGTSTFTVTATDSTTPTAQTASKSLSITVGTGLTVTTTTLANGVVGTSYSQTLASSGGTSPITWSISVGSLPNGLSLASTTGVISGTPTASGTSSFTVKATDSTTGTPLTATKALSIVVASALTISTTALPNGAINSAYSQTLASNGGTSPITWSISSGTLPNGLSLASTTGIISGTPTASGSSTFTVKATDSSTPAQTATQVITLTITGTLTVTCSTTTTGVQGFAFNSGVITVTGGTQPYTFSIVGGLSNLPAGLTLNTTSGAVSGAPTGTGTFAIQVKDANGLTGSTCSITIQPPLTITTTSLPQGSPGVAYSYQPTFVGGTAPFTWAVRGLPSGLNFSSSTGLISGSPRSNGTSSVTISVQDSTSPTPQTYTTSTLQLVIANSPLTVSSNPSPLANAIIGQAYSGQIVISGGSPPYNVSANTTSPTYPAWLTFDTSTNGAICMASQYSLCGTPTSANIGANTFIITVTDNGGNSVNQPFTVQVTQSGGLGAITMSSVTVGQGLQVPVTITFNPAPSFGVTNPGGCTSASTPGCLSIVSSSGSVLIGQEGSGGSIQTLVPIAAGTTSVSFYAQADGASGGTATITASAPGYANGTGSVTIANSGFVVSGPNGIGGAFTTFQDVSTTLTVYAARLDSNNLFVEPEEVMGGSTVTVPIASVPTTIGTVSPTSLSFTGGTSSMTTTFKASSANTGTASVTITQPTSPFTFSNPATGGSLNVTVQQSGFLAPTVNVGQGLEVLTAISISGNAPSNTMVTLTSSNASNLQFACGSTAAGSGCSTGTGSPATSGTITVTIPQNQTQSASFYAIGLGAPGSVSYTISGGSFGSLQASVTIVPATLMVQAQSAILGENPQVTVSTAALVSGAPVPQAVAPNGTVTVTVTSSATNVGIITNPTVTITGGSLSGTTTFMPVAVGTATITAAATGFSSASTQVTVSSGATIQINNQATVGQYLENLNSMVLGAAAPAGGLQVTLSVAAGSTGLMQLAVNPTDPGSNSIVVTVPAGQSSATYYVYALQSSGTATYGATAPGYSSATDTVTLAPSGIDIFETTSSGAPTCAINCSVSLSGGPQTFTLFTNQLSTDGNNTIVEQQNLAGPTGPAAATTAGTASSNSTALTVASGTGLAVGQLVFGSGIAPGTFLASGAGTSWVLSQATTSALNSTTLTFYNSVLKVTVTDSNQSAGTLSSSGVAAIAPGADMGMLIFTPTATGSTMLSVVPPNGFIQIQGFPGSELNSISVTVGP